MHTKGPWTLCNDGDCSCMQVSSEHAPIAKVISGKWGDDYPALRLNMDKGSIGAVAEAYMEQIIYGEIPEDVALANARLIAAAPELMDDGHALMVAVFEWINGADNGSQLENCALALEATIHKAKENKNNG